jgi:hypothetical protein
MDQRLPAFAKARIRSRCFNRADSPSRYGDGGIKENLARALWLTVKVNARASGLGKSSEESVAERPRCSSEAAEY